MFWCISEHSGKNFGERHYIWARGRKFHKLTIFIFEKYGFAHFQIWIFFARARQFSKKLKFGFFLMTILQKISNFWFVCFHKFLNKFFNFEKMANFRSRVAYRNMRPRAKIFTKYENLDIVYIRRRGRIKKYQKNHRTISFWNLLKNFICTQKSLGKY